MIKIKDNSAFIWILLGIIAVLILGYLLPIYSYDDSPDPTEILCIEQCNLNDALCNSQVNVLAIGSFERCSDDFSSCIYSCLE